MQTYDITVFKQSRILLSLFFSPIILISAIFIGIEINSYFIPLLYFIISFLLIYYFIIGHLKITITNEEELIFSWEKKLFFNFKPIPTIKISDIRTLVVDGQFLRKIKTDKEIIHINNSKIKLREAERFINKLINYENKNVRIIDSWDEFGEKGYLKIAYRINSLLIIISIFAILISTILIGFKPLSFSLLFLFIPQMLLYKYQIKDKIK